MNELPPDNDRQPPVRLPRERLVLPGPRALWWLVAALAIALPLSAHIAGELGEKSAPADAMTAELRGRTFMWRLLTNTQPQRQKTPGEKPPADAAAKEIQKAEDDDWRELVAHAREVDAAHAEARAREQVIVHALAVERPDRAVALAREVTVLSQDVRAVLAGLPDAPTASILDPKTALGLLHTRGFGHGWSAYQRDQARRLAYERLELANRLMDDAWLDSFAAGTVGGDDAVLDADDRHARLRCSCSRRQRIAATTARSRSLTGLGNARSIAGRCAVSSRK